MLVLLKRIVCKVYIVAQCAGMFIILTSVRIIARIFETSVRIS
jgi:hypothetical protein